MTHEEQAEIIAKACGQAGIGSDIRWIENKKQADTWAERIATDCQFEKPIPVKSSYMYCNSLDMCFFYYQGTPAVAYTGYLTADCQDITSGKLIEAFQTANKILQLMEKFEEEHHDQQ